MSRFLRLELKILAKLILKRYRPTIIGITGSIGKTSAKEAIAQILGDKLSYRASFKHCNNEIGVPLTIIGVISPGRNLILWFKVFFQALKLILINDKNYPKILILEMGVNRPGDINYLTDIAPINLALVTTISYSHSEYFGSLNNIKKEKQVLVEKLKSNGLAILNYDNEPTREMKSASPARVLTYGLSIGADLRAQDIVYNYSRGDYELSGLNFKLNYQGSIVPVIMKNVFSETAIYAALAAVAVGLYFNFNLVELAGRLKDFILPRGRMTLLPGLKNTFIIDDSYNSSPEAALAAINVLSQVKIDEIASRYAVLGEMLEIGHYTEEGHRLVGAKVFESGVDYLIAIGEKSRDYIRGAQEAGMIEDNMFYFNTTDEASHFLRNRIKMGDVLLVKGSQAARLEKIVKDLMAEPENAPKLLVRQEKNWL